MNTLSAALAKIFTEECGELKKLLTEQNEGEFVQTKDNKYDIPEKMPLAEIVI